MKIRTDFVTNSSSSSYIIAYKKNNDDTNGTNGFYKSIYNRLINFVVKADYQSDTTSGIVIKSKTQLDRYFIETYGNIEKDKITDIIRRYPDDVKYDYNSCVDYINSGYSIIIKDIGYGDEMLLEIIKILGSGNKNFLSLNF